MIKSNVIKINLGCLKKLRDMICVIILDFSVIVDF